MLATNLSEGHDEIEMGTPLFQCPRLSVSVLVVASWKAAEIMQTSRCPDISGK